MLPSVPAGTVSRSFPATTIRSPRSGCAQTSRDPRWHDVPARVDPRRPDIAAFLRHRGRPYPTQQTAGAIATRRPAPFARARPVSASDRGRPALPTLLRARSRGWGQRVEPPGRERWSAAIGYSELGAPQSQKSSVPASAPPGRSGSPGIDARHANASSNGNRRSRSASRSCLGRPLTLATRLAAGRRRSCSASSTMIASGPRT